MSAIEHVVVLMLENRSFDHMLGYLDGLTTADGVPNDPSGEFPVRVPVHWLDTYSDVSIDPGHGFDDVRRQLTGNHPEGPWLAPYAITNDGFYWNYAAREDERQQRSTDPTEIMGCFERGALRGLSTLAESFTVCARWHCSLPSETWPNRLFAHAGSSFGATGFTRVWDLPSLPWEKTIFDLLEDAGRTWRVYAGDVPQVAVFGFSRSRFRRLNAFAADALSGDLPSYTFIEPQYFDLGNGPANSQHPVSELAGIPMTGYLKLGDELIERIYMALRSNDEVWARSLLVITYDEHGGFFDRVAPPTVDALAPPAENEFAFDLLGPRVPAVVVSPFVAPRVVDRKTLFDHTSLTRTVREVFDIEPGLSEREARANTLTRYLDLSNPRAPGDLPSFDEREPLAESETNADVPLGDFQRQLLELARHIDADAVAGFVVTNATTVAEAAPYVESFIERNFPHDGALAGREPDLVH